MDLLRHSADCDDDFRASHEAVPSISVVLDADALFLHHDPLLFSIKRNFNIKLTSKYKPGLNFSLEFKRNYVIGIKKEILTQKMKNLYRELSFDQ